MDPMLALGGLLIGLSLVLWGIGADKVLDLALTGNWLEDTAAAIDRERQACRSRNRF